MQFELFFFFKNSDWEEGILEQLKKIPSPYRVVTTSYSLNQFLRSSGIESATLGDIFPEEGGDTYEVHRRSKKLQGEYRRHFEKITYKGFKIFDGFENFLLRQIILLEKARKIFEENRSTVFVLERFSFAYFAIAKTAVEMGYEHRLGVCSLDGGRLKPLNPDGSFTSLQLKDMYYKFKSVYSIRDDEMPAASRGQALPEPASSKGKGKFSKIVSGASFYARSIFLPRMYRALGMDISWAIFKDISKEITRCGSANARYAFFLTTNPSDLYLKALYPVLDRLKEREIRYNIFAGDPTTARVLSEKGVPFVDLFAGASLMLQKIKGDREGREISDSICGMARDIDLSLICRNGRLSGEASEYVYRAAAFIAMSDYAIRLTEPEAVGIVVDGTHFGNCAAAVCEKVGKPTFFIPSTIINANPLHADWIKSGRIFMYGLQGQEALTELGYDRQRIILTGNPKYDFLKKLDSEKSKVTLESSHQIARDKKLVVVGMSRWHEGDEAWMSRLIKFCAKNNFEIVIKVHPIYKTVLSLEESEQRIGRIRDECQGLKYLVTYDADVYALISAADLVITDYSNIGAEAILLEKPVLTVNFRKEKWDNEQRYHEHGAAAHVEEYGEMESVILGIFEGRHLDAMEQGRKKIADMYNFYNDGKAAERIVDLIGAKQHVN